MTRRARFRGGARCAHRLVNALLVAGIVVQVYLAGLAVFGESFTPHAVLGWSLIPLALISAGLAAMGCGWGRRTVVSLLLTVSIAMQPVFVFVLSAVAVELAAIHTLNALFALGLGVHLEALSRPAPAIPAAGLTS